MTIWITSDTHFCHDKGFLYEPRGFSSAQEMNEAIIKNWNEMVAPEDDVYLLGDVMLSDNKEGMNCLRRLNGNIHIMLGNHDTGTRVALYATLFNVVEISFAHLLKYKGYRFYLSHYPTLTANHDDDKPLRRKVINLAGHSHTPDKWADWDKGAIYHVELDAHANYPVALDKIIEDLVNYH